MIKEVKKDEFSQGFVLNMKANEKVLVITETYAEYEVARQKVANAKKRMPDEMPSDVADYKAEKTDGNKLLVTAIKKDK